MTTDQMLKILIEACERYMLAKHSYDNHPGGGASQKIKNAKARQMKSSYTEMTNAVYNIKQFLK